MIIGDGGAQQCGCGNQQKSYSVSCRASAFRALGERIYVGFQLARYLVTGGSGFIGRALVRHLTSLGHEVIVASRVRPPANDENWVEYDLAETGTVANIVEASPDGIFHLAWSSTPALAETDPYTDARVNLAGTVALLDAISKGQTKVVFCSSGGTVYGDTGGRPALESMVGNPIGMYGLAKATVENYCRYFARYRNSKIRIARISNPYGSEQSLSKLQGAAPRFARQILRGEAVQIWGDGSIVRDYIHVEDAASGLVAVMQLNASQVSDENQSFNVGTSVGTSLNQLIEFLSEIIGLRASIMHLPGRPFDLDYNVLNCQKLRTASGWQPSLSLTAGLTKLVSDLRM
jgi:UDP-glucose 4-epimerase